MLALLVFILLPIVLLGALVGALVIFVLALPLVLVTTKDGTNCLLAGGIVGDSVIGGGGVAAQLSNQLLAGGSREESYDNVRVGDVGKLSALFGETTDIVMKGLARLLLTAPDVPRVARVYIGPLEVPFEHPFQIALVVDLSRWEVLEPCSSGIR
jgi:hypothetical protein